VMKANVESCREIVIARGDIGDLPQAFDSGSSGVRSRCAASRSATESSRSPSDRCLPDLAACTESTFRPAILRVRYHLHERLVF
jgi:hypothetical protein